MALAGSRVNWDFLPVLRVTSILRVAWDISWYALQKVEPTGAQTPVTKCAVLEM